MAIVVPFRAWRYLPERVGGLDRVVAPPYDVIGPELQQELHERSPHNVVRVDLPLPDPADHEDDGRYGRAAQVLDRWKGEGILVRDPDPRVTLVEETFTGPDGRSRTRRGLLACLRLEEFSSGVVFPHEATLSGPKEDRFRLMNSTGMGLSPVFLLYSLPHDPIMTGCTQILETAPSAEFTSDAEVHTRLWHCARPAFLDLLQASLHQQTLLIADGHHRYETALRYRAAQRSQGLESGPWEYVLVYLVNTADPGLAIFGTHRLLHDLPPESVDRLPDLLQTFFDVRLLTDDAAMAEEALRFFLAQRKTVEGAFGLYLPGRGAYGVLIRDREAPDRITAGKSYSYRHLDVVILHDLILEALLGITPADIAAGRHVTFFKEWGEAFRGLEKGTFQAGFFVNPMQLDQLWQVATAGERLPQKSTFFYPKITTGLVFHDLRDF